MSSVFPGRYTAQTDDLCVVFLLGMCVNNFWAVSQWLPVAQAMPPMLKTLWQHPEEGFIGGDNFFRLFPLTTLMLFDWRSFEDLERFVRSP